MSTETINRKIPDSAQHPNKIGIKEGLGYMLGDAGNLFVLTYVSSFLKVFYTDILKIGASKVADLFLFTRLWDAINDPMWGAIVAKRKPSKNGKYRPYVKWVSIPLSLSCFICFINVGPYQVSDTKTNMWVLVFAYITYIAFGMLYTGMNVPFGSLASVITDDPDGRTLLSTFRSIGGGIGGAAPLLVAPMIVYTKQVTANGDEIKLANANGFTMFGLAMCVLAIVFYLACYKSTKERIVSEAEPKFNMLETYSGLLKSKPFIILALSGILISGQLQFASLNQYLYKNYFCNTNLSIVGTIAQYLPMAIMIPLVPKLSKKFGKKELCTFGSFFSAAGAILTYVLRPQVVNSAADTNPKLFFALLFLMGFGYSFVSITNWAVVADVIDYQEFKTHAKEASAIYAVYTFCRKLGQTAADFGGLKLLAKAGYDIAATSKGFIPVVSPKIFQICTGIPAITYTLIFVLYLLFPLNKKNLEPVYAYIREENSSVSNAEETAV